MITHLDVHFLDIIEDEVHVFVESNDHSFESQVDDIVEPDLHSSLLETIVRIYA